ncbi:MAG TPA: tRNA(Ile2) 2-agmatinylcytidine synthetase [Syntrophus sp. (in: bacteria)]|nr:tRNA(Ile2) 2-agmatinylcytidine synthetase [Syntrophus sp. (in: bacteria)]
MILTREQVMERFGRYNYEGIITVVDAAAGKIEIVENFGHFPGSAEWTSINRCRAGGIVEECEIMGKTLITRARLGLAEVRFGPVDHELGGQALEGALIEGDTVRTKWAGVAGAGVSVAASLAQAPGVISVCYPTEDDLKIGGRRTNRAELITPRYEKIRVGIDDTDDPEGGATFMLAVQAQREAVKLGGVEPLLFRLVQLYPKSPFKTSNCTGTVMAFAVRPEMKEQFKSVIIDVVRSGTRSQDTGLAIMPGIDVPAALNAFGWEAKKRLVSLEETGVFENWNNLKLYEIGKGKQGRIGALASLGLSEERAAAALFEDKALLLIKR